MTSDSNPLPANRRRLLLAVYFDYCLFSACLGLTTHFVYLAEPDIRELPFPAKAALFVVIEFLFVQRIGWSPGAKLLSIHFAPPDRVEPIASEWNALWSRPAWADAWIKTHESWFTLLVGALLVNEGSKSLVRWTMWVPPAPFFGFATTPVQHAVLSVSMGAVELLLAMMVLRLRMIAAPTGVAYCLVNLATTATSWDLWDRWVADYVTRRRAFQGLPVREGEIEQMQAITPEVALAFLAAMLVAFLALFVPLRRARRNGPA